VTVLRVEGQKFPFPNYYGRPSNVPPKRGMEGRATGQKRAKRRQRLWEGEKKGGKRPSAFKKEKKRGIPHTTVAENAT